MTKRYSRKLISMWLLGVCATAYGYDNPIEGGITQVVSNQWNVPLPWMMVGSNTERNRMEITGRGHVDNQMGIIGANIPSHGNSALVSGPNAVWNNSLELQVGNLGASNRLEMVGGGQVQAGTATIGNRSASNQINVSGAGSVLDANKLVVGQTGTDNELTISNGGKVKSATGTLGSWILSDGNRATVSGVGSIWTNTGSLNVGNKGSANRLSVLAGGRVDSPVVNLGVWTFSSNNVVSVSGDGSLLNAPELNIGGTAATAGGTGNRVSVRDGGRIETTDLTIHTGNDLNLNSGGTFAIDNDFDASTDGFNWNDGGHLWVSGNLTGLPEKTFPYRTVLDGYDRTLTLDGGSLNPGDGKSLSIGHSGSRNSLVLTNGGTVEVSDFFEVGSNNSSDNKVLVHGTNSSLSVSSKISVGYEDAKRNIMEIVAGGRVSCQGGFVGSIYNANDNHVIVSGAGSSWTSSDYIGVGGYGSGNQMVITNGGSVGGKMGYIGYDKSASGNRVLVSGAGSVWNNGEALYLGGHKSGTSWITSGTNNSLTVEDDGWVFVGNVDTNNLRLVNSSGGIAVGDATGSAEMVVANQSTVTSGGSAIGLGAHDTGSVMVTGQGTEWNLNGSLPIFPSPAGALYVGHQGSNNRLTITDGARVVSGTGWANPSIIGLSAASTGNVAVVSGAGSVWDMTPVYPIPPLVPGSPPIISFASMPLVQATNDIQISSPTNVHMIMAVLDEFAVGNSGSQNQLIIESGGLVRSRKTSIGRNATANSNQVVVTGAGSVFHNEDALYLGGVKSGINWIDGGTGNSLTVSDGGWMLVGNPSTNYLEELSASGLIAVGDRSGSPEMIIANGSIVKSGAGFIGFSENESGSVVVTGAGSIWNNSNKFAVGLSGSGNHLYVTNGGLAQSVLSVMGLNAGSDANSTMISGNGSRWDAGEVLTVGMGGSSNQLSILDGGEVLGISGSIGGDRDARNNSVVVTGTGSTWNNSSDLSVGYNGSLSSLRIEDGGLVINSNGFIGVGFGSIANSVSVSGSESLWTNKNNLYVGYGGSSNRLVIADGARVENTHGYIGYDIHDIDFGSRLRNGPIFPPVISSSSGNSVLVSGANSIWNNDYDLYVGYNGSDNSLQIEDGGQVASSGGSVGYSETANGNTVTVTGEGSLWDARASFWGPVVIQPHITYKSDIYFPPGDWPVYQPSNFSVGDQGSSNHLSITDGGRVESATSYVGHEQTASHNTVLVSGENSEWNPSTLHIGYKGSENTLRIENGGKVTSLNGIIGYSESSNGNRVKIRGAGSEWLVGFRPIPIGPWPPITMDSTNRSSLSVESDISVEQQIIIERIDTFTVGQDGSHNRLEIEDGAFVENSDGIIGKNSNAWNNAIMVVGKNSEWNNTRDLSLGGYNALYISGEFAEVGTDRSEWRSGGRGNSLYVGDGGLVSVGRDLHNRNYSGIAIDPGGHISVASNYYQEATSALRFGVETNAASAPLNALITIGGTAELEAGARIEVASNVGTLEFDTFYTNKIIEANLLVIGGVTNANSLDLEQLNASGSLVDVLFWENHQDIYGLVGRKYLTDSAGFDPNSMMGRLSKEIDDLSLMENATAAGMINTLNAMSSAQQSAQLTQLYTQGIPTYMHRQGMHSGQQQVMAHARAFRSRSPSSEEIPESTADANTEGHGLRGWMQGYGSWEDHESSNAFSGFDQSVNGTVVGFDKMFGNLLAGGAGGYSRSTLTQNNRDSSDASTRFGILYATFVGEEWFGDVNVSYGRSQIETRSGTRFGAKGKSSADNYTIYVGGGKDIHLSDGGIIFTPETSLFIGYFDQDSYSDSIRDIDAYDRWSYQSRLGAALALQKQVGTVVLKPELRAYWLHEFNADADRIGYSLVGGTGRYSFGMQAPEEDILEAGIGIRTLFNDRLELMLGVDGQYSDRYEAVKASGRIAFKF